MTWDGGELWEETRRRIREQADAEWEREQRAREWASIVKLMRLNLERDIAHFSDYREIPALSDVGLPPITLEDAYQMVRALTKLKHLPDLGIVL